MPGPIVDLQDLQVRGRSKTNKRWRLAEQSSVPVDADLRSTASLANGHQPLSPQNVQAMQRTVGNQRTAQFLAQHRAPPVSTHSQVQSPEPASLRQNRFQGIEKSLKRGVRALGGLLSRAVGRRGGSGHGYDLSEGPEPPEPPLTHYQSPRPPDVTQDLGGSHGSATLPHAPLVEPPSKPRLAPTGDKVLAPNLRPHENEPGANPRTYWAKSAEELARFQTSAVGGMLFKTQVVYGPWPEHEQDQEHTGLLPLNTKFAEKSRLATSKPGRNMIVLRPDGGLYTADMAEEEARRPGENIHHSTLASGGEVAGAGEIETSETGELERVTDQSGHYQPEFVFTHQLLEGMEENGVDLSKTTVELGHKSDSSLGVREEAKPPQAQPGEKKNEGTQENKAKATKKPELYYGNVLMSANEALAWRKQVELARQQFAKSGDRTDLAAPERKIRELHQNKHAALLSIKGAYGRLAANNFVISPKFLPPPLPPETQTTDQTTTSQGGTEERPGVDVGNNHSTTQTEDEADAYQSRGETGGTGPVPAQGTNVTAEPQSSIDDRSITALLLAQVKEMNEESAAWELYREELMRRAEEKKREEEEKKRERERQT